MEIKIATRQFRDEQGLPCSLQYYLTIELVESPHFCFERYGIRIQDQNGSSACAPALTFSAAEIDELMTLLVDNFVTPVTLKDVVEDWMLRTPVPT